MRQNEAKADTPPAKKFATLVRHRRKMEKKAYHGLPLLLVSMFQTLI